MPSTLTERYPQFPWLFRGDKRGLRNATAFLESVEHFAATELAPGVAKLDGMGARHEVPEDLLRRCCDLKLFSAMFPRALGGLGLPPFAAMISFEILASYSVGFANLVGVNGLAIACVAATMDLRALAFVARLVTDHEKRRVAPFLSTCVTEPDSGSDAEDPEMIEINAPRTVATPVDGGFRLSGTKVFISNGSLAQLHVVIAVEDRQRPVETLRVLLVPADSKGVEVMRVEDKLGQKICPAAQMHFDDVFVSDDMRCRCSPSFPMATHGLPAVLGLTRGGVAAFAAGGATGISRTARDAIATSRSASPDGWQHEQWVDEDLARLEARAILARAAFVHAATGNEAAGLAALLTQSTALSKYVPALLRPFVLRLMAGKGATSAAHHMASKHTLATLDKTTMLGDAAKVTASELAWQNARSAMQLVGTEGTLHDSELEQFWRDIRLLSIYEGTNQINLLDLFHRGIARKMEAA